MREVRVGVGVIVVREGRLLLGKRLNAHGAGFWAAPGGHLEFGETPEACARRELLEETAMQVLSLERGPWVNTHFVDEGRHYVTLFMVADAVIGEPALRERDKCAEWRWIGIDDLPAPLFQPLDQALNEGLLDLQRLSCPI